MSLSFPQATTASSEHAIEVARRVLRIESEAVQNLSQRIDETFLQAVKLILECRGRVIVTGVGKSGHIARKIASTFASTGTPAFFVHAGEAAHGDLGMITSQDVVIAISYSGKSEEILMIVPLVKRQGAKLISLTGKPSSPLAVEADINLDGAITEEACPLNLAPTASTTVALALGDALAIVLLDARGFGAEDFARSHPGGALGRRLLTHVVDIMRKPTQVPQIEANDSVLDALLPMSKGGMGMIVVGSSGLPPEGIFTDGDLRRALGKNIDVQTTKVGEVMTRNPHTISSKALAADAARMMEEMRISQILVTDPDNNKLVGALTMHDLMRAGVI